MCKNSDAILLGTIGGKRWQNNPIKNRPERLLYHLRGDLGLAVNVRPAYINSSLSKLANIKSAVVQRGLDFTVVRDIVGGCIPSTKHSKQGAHGREVFDEEYYNEEIVSNTVNWAIKAASTRQKRVTCLDKSNALISSKLWREIF